MVGRIYGERIRSFIGATRDRLAWLCLRHKGRLRTPDFAFMVKNARHVDNLAAIARWLEECGHQPVFLDISRAYGGDARQRLRSLDVPVFDCRVFRNDALQPGVFVVMDDQDPFMAGMIDLARSRGIPTVAVVELAWNVVYVPNQYQYADHVLSVGAFDAERIGRACAVPVGSPFLDSYFSETPTFPARPMIAANCKFKRRHLGGRSSSEEVRGR